MTDLRQAAQQALEALKSAAIFVDSFRGQKATQEAITALKAALEQQAEPVAFITPLMEQQMFDDWCPYKGNPDPRTVWAAAIESVNGLLLGAYPPKAEQQAEPVQKPVEGNTLLKAFLADAEEAGVTHLQQAEPVAELQQVGPVEDMMLRRAALRSAKIVFDGRFVTKQAEPPPEWLLIKNILAEYGLQAISFVAAWKAAQQQAEPVLLECVTCGTVYADGVPPQVPVRGPVAYMHKETGLLRREIGRPKGADWDANYWDPLYTTPPQRQWVGLTVTTILNMMPSAIPAEYDGELMEFARAVEAKLKERNGY